GKEIAHRLASEGVRVFIVGSKEEKGQRAEAELRKASKSDSVHFIRADLSLMQDTYRLAEEITAHIPKLHYLVLCAGIVRGERTVTPEGIETNFAVDYLTRFALATRLLAPIQAAGAPDMAARMVIIGGAAQNGTIHYDDVNLTNRFNVLR